MITNTPEPAAFNPLDVVRLLGAAGGTLLRQATLHGDLARVEWAEEKARLSRMLAVALCGFASFLCAMLAIGALIIALSWDTTLRVPAALSLTAIYLVGTAIAWRRLKALSALGTEAFAATRDELAADLALLKSKL